jgi:hypothetical protein
MLYCTLTVQLIDQSIEAVKKHMQGKKFNRAKGEGAAVVVAAWLGSMSACQQHARISVFTRWISVI